MGVERAAAPEMCGLRGPRTHGEIHIRWVESSSEWIREHTPGAKARFVSGAMRPKAEALGHLAATATTEAGSRSSRCAKDDKEHFSDGFRVDWVVGWVGRFRTVCGGS